MLDTTYKAKRDRKGRFSKGLGGKIALGIFLLIGAVYGWILTVDWANTHELQRPWHFELREDRFTNEIRARLPYKDIEPIFLEPIVVEVMSEDLTPVEQKIVEKWGYTDGAVAIAIARCESGMDQYAVSSAGALGIFQIHWAAHGSKVRALDRTSADLLTDIDFNIDMAYSIWSNAGEAWHDWDVYNSGVYLSCF